MSVLVICEIQHGVVSSGTLSAISAAKELSDQIHVLVLGKDVAPFCKTISAIEGVEKVLQAEQDFYEHALAESIGPVVAELSSHYTHIVTASSTFGKNFMPRVAAMLDVMLVSDVTKIIDDKTFERPIYAGNAVATVESSDTIKLLTIRPTAFEASTATQAECPIEKIDFSFQAPNTKFISAHIPELERPELSSAKIVISGGRGLQSKENFSLIERVADKLNAAIGASRAAVDAGFVPNDYQVGQTGKIVAPDLYIAVGISGAIQHLAGMKDSKIIVAINKDAEAPIFQVADYGLVGDLFDILPEFEKQIS